MKTFFRLPLVLFPFCLALLLCCAGCNLPIVTEPLVKPADAKIDEALCGAWLWETPETTSQAVIGRITRDDLPNGLMVMHVIGYDKKECRAQNTTLYFFTVATKTARYACLLLTQLDISNRSAFPKFDPKAIDGYLVIKYSFTLQEKDQTGILTTQLMNLKKAEQAIEAKSIAGTIAPTKDSFNKVKITEQPDKLLAYLDSHSELFEEAKISKLTRVE